MNKDREQLTPEEREQMRRSNVNRKRHNDAKFSTVADMRKQLNALIEDMSAEMHRMSED